MKSRIQIVLVFIFLIVQTVNSQTFDKGYYRLSTQWLGEAKSLDVINDGVNNQLHLTHTANATGQFWKFTPLSDGYYRLTTQWQGENKSLDVVNDGTNNKLQLAKTGDFSGQYWKIMSLSEVKESQSVNQKFQNFYLSGFKIIVDEKLAEKAETKECLKIIAKNLEEISKIVKPHNVEKLKKIPIWLEYKFKTDGAAWYHTDKNWLISNGYSAELENSVEIKNIRNFIDWQGDQPYMLLHELAHGFEDLFLSEMQDKITKAYNNAVSSGKYNSVSYIRGGKQKAYALTNKTEYFAELTEAYFGKNDYYPFNKADLKEFDPLGYELMETAWK